MHNEDTHQDDENVIDLGTNTEFRVEYKTIRDGSGRRFTIARKEVIEPELPERKKQFKPGPGRPKKVKEPVEPKSMDDDTKIDMGALMDRAIKTVDK